MFKNLDLVILCGGKGLRIKKLTKETPKPLLKFEGIPFVRYLINFYSKYDFKNIYFLAGYKGYKFKKLYHDKVINCIKCKVIIEKKFLGTGGALRLLNNKIKNNFLLINGDSYIDYNLEKFINFKKNKNKILLIKNKNYLTNKKLSNLNYNKKNKTTIFSNKKEKLINGGVYYLKKSFLKNITPKTLSIENEILPNQIKKKKFVSMETKGFFIDIGTYKNFFQAKKKLYKNFYKPALFLDRDGVLNYDNRYVYKFKDFIWMPGIINLLKSYTNKSYYIFILTNQSGIGRGFYSEEDFFILQKKIKNYLLLRGIYIHDLIFCPHHTQAHGKYKKNCNFRKPNNGMFLNILKNWPIDLNKSLMIGDKITDEIAAKKTGIKFTYYKNIIQKFL